ncbi:MAG: hypothetical protein RLZ04_1940 [Actinomycetota bacterium]
MSPLSPRSSRRPPPTTLALADHLDLMERELLSGSSLRVALELHGDPRHGGRGDEVSADAALVTHALDLAERLGGPQAACLHHAAAALREREAIAHEARSHAAAAWASARLLTIVPAAFVAWGLVTSSSLRSALITPAGLTCGLVGGGLNAVGWRWMRSIVASVAR